jgi:hypothetical protein
MPTAFINGAKIYSEIIGHNGPWVAAIPGGRHAHSEIEELTRAIASRGYRVIVHDRRNCGRSSLDFNTLEPEDDVWVDDLHALLNYLDASRTFVVGKSRARASPSALPSVIQIRHAASGCGDLAVAAPPLSSLMITTMGSTCAHVRKEE